MRALKVSLVAALFLAPLLSVAHAAQLVTLRSASRALLVNAMINHRALGLALTSAEDSATTYAGVYSIEQRSAGESYLTVAKQAVGRLLATSGDRPTRITGKVNREPSDLVQAAANRMALAGIEGDPMEATADKLESQIERALATNRVLTFSGQATNSTSSATYAAIVDLDEQEVIVLVSGSVE